MGVHVLHVDTCNTQSYIPTCIVSTKPMHVAPTCAVGDFDRKQLTKSNVE